MTCLSCGGDCAEVFKLGDFYLCDFVDPGESRGDRYPLRMVLCNVCALLQLGDIVPRRKVITGRYGFMTGLNEQNREDVRSIALYAHQHKPDAKTWLDIGCNDGTLLSNAPEGVQRWGCDPLLAFDNFLDAAMRNGMKVIDRSYFNPDNYGHGQFDVVFSTAMFYALDEPAKFVEGVRQVLARDGIWVIQQNYALHMLANNTVDNIIHEHVAFYTVQSLRDLLIRHGLDIADVTYSKAKGGCFRTLVTHKGARPVLPSVSHALSMEWTSGVDDPGIWQGWHERVREKLHRTSVLLDQLDAQGRPAYCLGAGNRGGTLVQLLGSDLIPYAVERGEQKVGKMWTSTGMPIISEDQFRQDNPSYALVSPWFFRENIVPRERAYLDKGGKLIIPLPKFELVTA